MSPTRRNLLRASAGALASAILPVTAVAAEPGPERKGGVYIDASEATSLSDVRTFMVWQRADGSIRMDAVPKTA